MKRFALVAIALLAFHPIQASAAGSAPILKLTIDGMIHQGTVSMLEKALEHAKAERAQAVLIRLDTPGGVLDSTRDLVKLLLNTDTPVIVYVAPSGARAGSAGTFLTMAAHVAAMAPGTNIGAAHPITVTGKDPEAEGGKHLAKKVESDTLAFIEIIAKARGRNVEWAKTAVLESASITDDRALELNVIDLIAKTETELLERIDGREVKTQNETHTLATSGAAVLSFRPDFETRVINALANPTVMFLLVLVAALGLYMEVSNPGLIVPGVASAVAIILLLIANSVLPLSVVGVGLLAAGFVLLVMEIYFTSFGLLALAGTAVFIIGAMFLFDPRNIDVGVPRAIIFSTSLAFGIVSLIIATAVARTFRRRQFSGKEGLIGKSATAESPILPGAGGKVFVEGEYWNAVSDEEIPKGAAVEIVSVTGLKVRVKRGA